MRIGIIGTGNIGGTLGRRWAARHDVVFGTRRPEASEVRALVEAAGARARAAPVREAAAFGDVVALATPWAATLDAVRGAGDLAGKVVVDCTNPVGPGLAHGLPSRSAAEAIAAAAPSARVVKAFNTAGFEVYADPRFASEAASLFLCGDEAAAKATVAGLARELGMEPVDCGGLAQARRLEELALLWISLAAQGQGRAHAFRLLRR
jgi:8-hydroxy-5-deazaflavin:NADPH oxidoreductase